MLKRIISSLAAFSVALVFASTALANVPSGTTVCAIRADQSGVNLTQVIKIANAPSGSSASVVAHLEAGTTFSINGVLLAPGTPIGTPQAGEFDPNDLLHPFTWSEPINATKSGASVSGEVNLVLDKANVTLADGNPGWSLKGSQTYANSVACVLSIVTNTITLPGTVTSITLPGKDVVHNVNVPVPGRTIFKRLTIVKWRKLKATASGECPKHWRTLVTWSNNHLHVTVGCTPPRAGGTTG